MRRRSAFTLVELLVVIGIIAVLISILLPTLSRVRESGQRTACLSNMRELSNMLKMYSVGYKDAFPIGFMDQKGFSYVMYWNNGATPPKATQMGLLVEAGIVKNPKTFFCPSEIVDQQFTYQPNPDAVTPSLNPWPFWSGPIGGSTRHTRLGYSCRPMVNWPANSGPYTTNQSLSGFWVPPNMPKFSKLGSVAILADTNYCKAKILARHKKGINVLYGNGGAHWVDLKAFNKTPWNTWDENSAFLQSNNPFYLDDGTWPNGNSGGAGTKYTAKGGLWFDLDSQ
jgi:prepilin-type N-terminal cleavage/methylation domain-containing protein